MEPYNTFNLYKLLLEEVRETRRARRELSDRYLALNVAGVAGVASLANSGGQPALTFWSCLALIYVCFLWRTSNHYYRSVLAAKYSVIYDLERSLESQPIAQEWRNVQRDKPSRSFSLEFAMPVLFTLGYLAFMVFQISLDQVVAFARTASETVTHLIRR